MPRQPVPENIELPKANRIISPSLSSASALDEEEERYTRSRQTLSPSPEVDLSSPELEEESQQQPPTPGAPFSGRNSVARERSESETNLSRNRRAASPQLEHEERDFKQTASALYEQALQRRNSQQSQHDINMDQVDASAGAEQDSESVSMSIEESEESTELKNIESAAALFGHHTDHLKVQHPMDMFSSPMLQPQSALRVETAQLKSGGKLEDPMVLDLTQQQKDVDGAMLVDWDTLQSPENVELAELDDMFDAY